MPFKDNLATIMEQKGIDAAFLSRESGLSPQMVYNYIKGASQPTVEKLAKIANALEVSSDALVFGKSDVASSLEDKVSKFLLDSLFESKLLKLSRKDFNRIKDLLIEKHSLQTSTDDEMKKDIQMSVKIYSVAS